MAALPSNAALLTAIQGMTVTGVARHYLQPPASIDLANGYAAFPTMPDSGRGEMVSTCVDMSKTRSISYVVIVESVGQDTNDANYGKLAAVMDNLETAIDALTYNFIDYTISTTGSYFVGNVAHWAVVANISVRSG